MNRMFHKNVNSQSTTLESLSAIFRPFLFFGKSYELNLPCLLSSLLAGELLQLSDSYGSIVFMYNIFYVPQPRKLVFPLQLRVKQCCIFRYRGIQCRNWTGHALYSLTAERNLFLILLLLTSSSCSVSTDYYTRLIKSKWPGLVANFRPLRTTSAANNYNKY